MKLENLSMFFPLYNEEENVEELTKQAVKACKQNAKEYEVILVNDGSKDGTEQIAKRLEQEYPNVRLISQENKGYGGALKTGFANCKHDWVFFSDGDLQFDLNELSKLVPHANDNDLVIGYRHKRADGFMRDLIAFGLKVWNKLFLNFHFL